VLGPVLVVGLVGLGIAHGACDQLVLPACQLVPATGWRYQLGFGAGYLGLAGAVGLAWWWWPGVAVGLFFVLSAWHWGSADAPAHPRRAVWVVHSLLRGALLLVLPAAWWPTETAGHVNGLLALGGAAPVAVSNWPAAAALVLAGHLVLWGYFAWQRKPGRWHRDALEVGLLVGLFEALPPLLGLGVYFVFWHSLQHVLRLAPLLGYRAARAGARAGAPVFYAARVAYAGRECRPTGGRLRAGQHLATRWQCLARASCAGRSCSYPTARAAGELGDGRAQVAAAHRLGHYLQQRLEHRPHIGRQQALACGVGVHAVGQVKLGAAEHAG
jgi:Brp/Blh family beta-carotene 15,15'-monooxygenase